MSDITLPVTPSLRLDGRRALVTGAGRGIGFGASVALATAGAHVTLCDVSEQHCRKAVEALQAKGLSAEALVLDVTDLAAVRAAVEAADPFDIFLNNAGTNRPAAFTEVKESDFDFVMNLNVRASFFAAQAVARRMIAGKRTGSIINTSSTMGKVAMPSRALYCTSKWAVEGYSRVMAIELAPHGIRVNTLCPTFIETPLTKPMFENAAFKASVLPKIKLGRIGTIEDLMGVIVFLASDASAMMTGSSVLVDGGWTID